MKDRFFILCLLLAIVVVNTFCFLSIKEYEEIPNNNLIEEALIAKIISLEEDLQIMMVVLNKDNHNETGNKLEADSDIYKYRETPNEILYAIHKMETSNGVNFTGKSLTNDYGNMQFQEKTWEAYCPDLTVGNIHDDVECADRYINANYVKSVKEGYSTRWSLWHAIFMYNHNPKYVNKALQIAYLSGFNY